MRLTRSAFCSFVERVERIDDEIGALNEGKKGVFAEAKGEASM